MVLGVPPILTERGICRYEGDRAKVREQKETLSGKMRRRLFVFLNWPTRGELIPERLQGLFDRGSE